MNIQMTCPNSINLNTLQEQERDDSDLKTQTLVQKGFQGIGLVIVWSLQ